MPSDSPLYNEEPQQDEQAHQTSPSWGAVFLGAVSRVGSFFSSIFYGIKLGVQGLWRSLKHIADLKWWTGSEQNQQHLSASVTVSADLGFSESGTLPSTLLSSELQRSCAETMTEPHLSLLEQLVAKYELPVGHKILSFKDESSNNESPLQLLLLSRLETPYSAALDEIDNFLSEKLLKEVTELDFSRIMLSPRQPDFNDAMVTLLQRNPHITSIQFHPEDVALLDDTIQKQLNNNKCLAVCNALLSQDPTDERYEQRHVKGVRDALLYDIPVRRFAEAATFSLLEFGSETFNSSRVENERKQALQAAYNALLQTFDSHSESLIDECQDEFICAYAAYAECDVREMILPTVLLNIVRPNADIFIERFLALNPFIIKVTREDGQLLSPPTQKLLQERQVQRMSLHLLRAGAQGALTTKLSAWNVERMAYDRSMFNQLTQHASQERKESEVKALSPSLIDKFCGVFSQLTAGLSAYISSFMPESERAERKTTSILPRSNSFETISGALGSTQQFEAKPAQQKQEPELGLEELKHIGRDLGIDFPFDDVQFEDKKKREVERIYALITDYEREPNLAKLYGEVYPEILYKGLLGRKNMQYNDRVYSREAELNAEVANIKLLIDDPLKLCKIKQFLVYPDKNLELKEKAEKVSRFVNNMKDWISKQADCSRLWPHEKGKAEYAIYLFQLAQGCRIDREIKITRENYKKEMEVIYAKMHREIDDLIKFYQGISRRFEKVDADCDILLKKLNASDTNHKHGYSEEEKLALIKKLKNGESLTEEEHEFAKKIIQKVKKSQEKLTESQEEKSVGSIFSGVGHFSSSTVRKSVSDPSMTFQDLHDAQVGYKADSITRPASFTSSYS